MRIGQNPAKAGIKARKPKRLGIVVITYVPNQEGYFSESLKILKIVIASLRKNTNEDFDLYVIDNGSCTEVQNELTELNQIGEIDYLLLSHHNIGKIGALNWAIASMPNEWIVYTDSDFLFRKHWFEQSMAIAEAFPEAAMITAQPNIFDQLEGKSQVTCHLEEMNLRGVTGKLDRDVIEDYCRGIGATIEMRKKFLSMSSLFIENPDSAVRAVFGACTAQFIGRREMLSKVFPLPHEFVISREEDNEICRKVDSLGWLQLSTMTPYVVHIGNRLDDTILQEIAEDELTSLPDSKKALQKDYKSSPAWKLLVNLNRVPLLKKIFKRLYVNLFELYSIEKK